MARRIEIEQRASVYNYTPRPRIIVLVYGGRKCSEMKCFEWLALYGRNAVATMAPPRFKIVKVVHGNACGADKAGGRWARAIDAIEYPFDAEWSLAGHRGAGKVRNQVMADYAKVDCAIEFPGGKGTEDMRLRLAGREIPFYQAEGDFK